MLQPLPPPQRAASCSVLTVGRTPEMLGMPSGSLWDAPPTSTLGSFHSRLAALPASMLDLSKMDG